VCWVEQASQARKVRDFGEQRQQILSVAVLGPRAKPVALPQLRQFQPLAGTGNDRTIEQAVVLKESKEDDGENPVHRRLIHRGVEEGIEGIGSSLRFPRLLPLCLDRRAPGR
jgi:hypothetical protein